MRLTFREAALALGAGLWLVAVPAAATTFFGEDVPPGGGIPASHPNSSAQQAAFLSLLLDPGTEDFSAFKSGDDGPLDLVFRNPAGSGSAVETGTLFDPSSRGKGFIATAQIAKTGFPISGRTYWKNTTDAEDRADEGLFRVDFDDPVRAFGFFAMAYSTLSRPGGTQLVLDLELVGGGTQSFVIPHDVTDTLTGKVFYFGVTSDPFVAATLRNTGAKHGDVIGFDDFTVAHTIVPEPATASLLAAGLAGLALWRRSAVRGPRERA